jgi:hypothetical protein
MQYRYLKEIRMKNVATDTNRQTSGSSSTSAPFRPSETTKFTFSNPLTTEAPSEVTEEVAGQSERFDVMGGTDKVDFETIDGSDGGAFDVLGGPDKGDFDVLGAFGSRDFDVMGRADRGGFDLLGYKR